MTPAYSAKNKEETPSMAKLPIRPRNPERVCWGCDKYCSSNALRCGNGTIRTPHPTELFGEDWMNWGIEAHSSDPNAGEADKKLTVKDDVARNVDPDVGKISGS
jgi:hypothetical protein